MARVGQTRMKLTWFGAISILVVMLVALIIKTDDASTIISVGIPSLTSLIIGYHGSQAYTKGQYLKNNKGNDKLEG